VVIRFAAFIGFGFLITCLFGLGFRWLFQDLDNWLFGCLDFGIFRFGIWIIWRFNLDLDFYFSSGYWLGFFLQDIGVDRDVKMLRFIAPSLPFRSSVLKLRRLVKIPGCLVLLRYQFMFFVRGALTMFYMSFATDIYLLRSEFIQHKLRKRVRDSVLADRFCIYVAFKK
jgi:hypothetical protein